VADSESDGTVGGSFAAGGGADRAGNIVLHSIAIASDMVQIGRDDVGRDLRRHSLEADTESV